MPARVRKQWSGDAIKARVQAGEAAAAAIIGQRVTGYMQELVPVDTGALKASLAAHTTRAGNGYIITFGSFGVLYAIYVELGTSRMRAQPYIRPPADRIAGEVGGILRSQLA